MLLQSISNHNRTWKLQGRTNYCTIARVLQYVPHLHTYEVQYEHFWGTSFLLTVCLFRVLVLVLILVLVFLWLHFVTHVLFCAWRFPLSLPLPVPHPSGVRTDTGGRRWPERGKGRPLHAPRRHGVVPAYQERSVLSRHLEKGDSFATGRVQAFVLLSGGLVK